jgi:outer membrane receptor protein involved in Fe transport
MLLEALRRDLRGRGLAALCALACVQASAATEAITPGMSLREAVRILEPHIGRVFYSTVLIRAWMRVEAAPSAADPVAALEEILEPHGLTTEPGPGASLLIVRDPGAQVAAVRVPSPLPAPAKPVERVQPETPLLEEIIVAASRYELDRAVGTSHMSMSGADIEYLPDLGDDAIRAASRLPGMASNGVSSRANVRGGEVSETLVRFDGLRLYDPFHLKDFQSIFSTLDPRVVSSMDVYTGGFPAPFGDRMSGVIDVASMSPPDDRYYEIGMSFFNTSLLSAGRFADARGEWVASARRSNLDLLYGTFSDLPERPGYIDAFAKISFAVNERLAISGNLLAAKDDISLADDIDREERAHADHRDSYYWLRLDHTLSSELSGTTLLARSNLASERRGASAKAGISAGMLVDKREFVIESAQTDWSKALNDRLVLLFGGTISRLLGRYDYSDEVSFDLLFDLPGAETEASRERVLALSADGYQFDSYVSLRFSPTRRLTGDFGLRWDKQTLDPTGSSSLSPRVGVRYRFGERTDLRASIGRFSQSQAINELQISDGVDRFFRPQRADHFVIGIEHRFEGGLGLRVEAYRKSMDHLRPRYENLLNSLILLPELKPDRIRIAPERARADGIEVMLDQQLGQMSWWVAYSRASAKDRIDGQWIYRSWDQTHALTAGLNWDTPRWNVGTAFSRRSGWPTSHVILDDRGELPIARVLERNANRIEYYRTLDLRLTRKIELERGDLSVSLELTNLTNRSNACCVEYEIGDEDEAGMLLLKTLDYLPRVPSLGFLWAF